ncbi:hypothetical protein DUNSADRAFT_1353 [Dunaliella salina]|uniref:RNA polymerase II C-terminal domain phosphatase-like n=1 Tax=Dunaliella salina TaxID=3046 RepID=A0ABQ7GXE0_DUNSA|nr:hypothetical protein DUNSADRAFT_1353 [Dunaliella salina]|eukprot:KAF5839217.1 hypothetical protein DUNSADRAFT_1353 [Dunaliella salina]
MGDLSAAFDDEFGQDDDDWGAENEAIEQDNNGNTVGDHIEEEDRQDAAELAAAEEEGAAASAGVRARDAPSTHQPAAADSSDARAAKRRRTGATAAFPGQDAALMVDSRDGGVGDGMGEDADIELPCSQGTGSAGPSIVRSSTGRHLTATGAAAALPFQQQNPQCEHPSYWAGMCVCCGALKPEDDGVVTAGGGVGAVAEAGSAGQHGPGGGRFKAAGGRRRGLLRPSPPSSSTLTAPSAPPADQLPFGQQPPTQAAAHSHAADARPAQGEGLAPKVGARRNPPKQAAGVRSPARASEEPQFDRHGLQGLRTSFRQQHQPEQLTRIRHLHERGHMEVSTGEAARVRQREVARLLNSRRLVLILDLDHTLLHSVRLAEVPPELVTQLEAIQRAESTGQAQLLHCLRLQNLWTKLRPGVFEFLEACRGLFEMHIYTMGDRSYAAQIRALLDPQRRLFSSVISQNDSTSTAAKNLDVALADDRIVLILDDTEFVWPHHRRNLIQVERYHFFPGAMRPVDGISGLLDLKLDESSSQGTLASVLGVLRDVHSRFFGSPEGIPEDAESIASLPLERRDVRYCLLQRREEILKVAGSAATEKAIQAKRHGKHVVAPDWLRACMFRWQREDETKYAATPHRNPQLFMSPLAPLRMAETPPPPSNLPPHPESACAQTSPEAPQPPAAAAAITAATPAPLAEAAPSPPAAAAATESAAAEEPQQVQQRAGPQAAGPSPPAAATEPGAAGEPPEQCPVGASDARHQESQQDQQAGSQAVAAAAATAATAGPPMEHAAQPVVAPPELPGADAHAAGAHAAGAHAADAHASAGGQQVARSPVLPGQDAHSIQGRNAIFIPQCEGSLVTGAREPQQYEAQHVTSALAQSTVSNNDGHTHQQSSINAQRGDPADGQVGCANGGLGREQNSKES